MKMNRAMRRKQEKMLKRKLTDKQFQQLQSETTQELIEQRIEEGKARTVEAITIALQETLGDKKFRISKERQSAILNDFIARVNDKNKGE